CFFSSRRRHTTSKRDWSSDVCSSDLRKLGGILQYARHEDRMLAFAGAGLSTPIEELLDHPGATFLRRAEHHTIGPVSRSDVRTEIGRASCRERVEIGVVGE